LKRGPRAAADDGAATLYATLFDRPASHQRQESQAATYAGSDADAGDPRSERNTDVVIPRSCLAKRNRP